MNAVESAGHDGDRASHHATTGVGLQHAGAAMPRPVKRSFTISGHRTSISLEAAFWDALKSIATEEKVSAAALIGRIDATRGTAGLSSAVRVWILHHYRERAERNRG
jgi:predicted DNA-binding ribbon-helix-helix protein